MSQINWLQSASFRTACLYAVLFLAAVLTIFGTTYVLVQAEMESNLSVSIDKDVATLLADYNRAALTVLQEGVDERLSETQGLDRVYALVDSNGVVLSGNAASFPSQTGVYYGAVRPSASSTDAALGVDHVFGKTVAVGNALLFVGRDATAMAETLETLFGTFVIGGIVTALAALLLGLMLGQHATKRIRTLGQITQSIVANGMKDRIPLQGRGDEIDMIATEFNLVLNRMQKLMENIRKITDDIAHDLRTPLSRLRQKLDTALNSKPASATVFRKTIKHAIVETDNMMDTFSALLRIAQIEGGARRSSFSEVSLSDVVESLIEIYEPVIEDAKLVLRADSQPNILITGDRELLVQLFVNLIENAIRHGRSGGEIHLSLSKSAGFARVVVADRGPGVPQAEYEKVFQRLYRADKSRSTKGNGLGLSLVAAIADLHDAKVSLEDNQPGLRVSVVMKVTELHRSLTV